MAFAHPRIPGVVKAAATSLTEMQLLPVPMNMETDKAMTDNTRFWNKIAERYSRQPIADQETYEKKLSLTRKYLDPKARVLEFGCGTGSTAILHAPYVGEIIATDFSQGMIDIANRKLEESAIPNLRFECQTLFSADLDAARFDAILGLNVLHLMPDYKAAVKRAHSLLVDGGIFVTSTPCLSELPWLLKPLLNLGGFFGLIPKLTYFSARELKDALRESGFEIIDRLPPGKTARGLFLVARK